MFFHHLLSTSWFGLTTSYIKALLPCCYIGLSLIKAIWLFCCRCLNKACVSCGIGLVLNQQATYLSVHASNYVLVNEKENN